MKKKENGYYVVIIALLFVFSLIYVKTNNSDLRQTYSSNKKDEKDEIIIQNDFLPEIGDEIIVGDISVSGRSVTVKKYVESSYTKHETFYCSSCDSSIEATKNADGTYKPSECSGKNPCYVNHYVTYSTKGTVSYVITTGNWLMSDGDDHSCEGSCTLNAGSSSSTCTVSGACPGAITASGGNKTYETKVSLDGVVLDSGKINVEYCSPTWSKGTTTKFFKAVWDKQTAIENKEKVYMEGCTPVTCSKDGNCSLYRCDPGQWSVRCGANPPAVSVCVYTPSGIGDNSFKYANSYKMTDSPTADELNYVALDKDANTCKGCFGNTPTFARSTNTSWSTGPSSATPYKYDERTTEESCKSLPEPRVCAPQDYSDGRVLDETKLCEEEKSIFFEDGKKCVGSSTDAFYEIKCVNKIANYFDFNVDDIEVEVLDIKQGQSFGYEIGSTSSKICYAKFNADVWKKAYDRVQTKFQALQNESVRVSAVEKESARQWYVTVQSKIFAQINDYMYWVPSIENNPDAKVSLKLNGKFQPLNSSKGEKTSHKVVELIIDDEKTIDASYDKIATNDGRVLGIYQQYKDEMETNRNGVPIMVKNSSGKEVPIDIAKDFGIEIKANEQQPTFNVDLSKGLYVGESMPSPAINLASVKNFLWITPIKREVYLIPPKISLNWVDGSVIGTGITPQVVVDGYNRIYTSKDIAKNNIYDLNVSLENLGGNGSIVEDNKCKLRVLDRVLIYRVIEESNPFVNESRKKGYNWYRTSLDGTLYDFTQIIPNSNEYSVTYNLSPSDIKTIKRSNNSNSDAYLGTCYLNLNDNAREILCK